jgi:hypothetical protein
MLLEITGATVCGGDPPHFRYLEVPAAVFESQAVAKDSFRESSQLFGGL